MHTRKTIVSESEIKEEGVESDKSAIGNIATTWKLAGNSGYEMTQCVSSGT